jgi:hypothetical protein
MGTKADSRRAHPHRLVAPKLKKPADAMRSSGFAATAPAAAFSGAPGAPSAIPRISTTDIIARARKQVQNPHDGLLGRRATTGGLRPIGENADLQRVIGALWRELNRLTGTTAMPPDAPPEASLQHAVKRLRATAEKLIAQRKRHEEQASAQAEVLTQAHAQQAEMLEASRKLEEQIRAERQQARDNQQAVRAVVQQNEQLAQELHATREALQQALQSASLVGSGITEEGSDIRESSSSDSDSSQHDGAEQDKSHAERQVGDDESRVPSTVSDLPPSLRHSVAAISGDALLTETSRAAKDGERRRLRSVEERLENERAARQRAESMVEDAEDETQTVQRLRQVETEQWVVELERVEAAAKTEIDRLAEEREEARETAMILEDDLQHERKHTIGALPTPRCVCLWCLSVCLFVCLFDCCASPLNLSLAASVRSARDRRGRSGPRRGHGGGTAPLRADRATPGPAHHSPEPRKRPQQQQRQRRGG